MEFEGSNFQGFKYTVGGGGGRFMQGYKELEKAEGRQANNYWNNKFGVLSKRELFQYCS